MPGIFDILHIGNSALGASGFGVNATGQNIANASTPGYHRRTVQLQTGTPVQRGRLILGSGVDVVGAQRIASRTLDARVRTAQAGASASDARANLLSRAEAIFSDLQGGGISASLDRFFDSFSGLAADPQSATARSATLDASSNLAGQIREHAQQLNGIQAELDRELELQVREVNRLTTELANVNKQVLQTNPPAPDTLDRQSALLTELSAKVEIQALHQSNGTVDVILPDTGFSLVSGNSPNTLNAQASGTGRIEVTGDQAGFSRTLTANLTGGEIGGLVQARDSDINGLLNDLDAFANDLASAVNAVHSAGFGADGVTGRALFSVAGAQGAAANFSLDAAVSGNPDALAASGSATLTGDNGQAILLSQLRGSLVVNGRTPSEAYAGVLESFGGKMRSAEISAISTAGALANVSALQQSQSGVSIDEEMTALLQYRQAYAAAAQVIRTADELLGEVLSLKR